MVDTHPARPIYYLVDVTRSVITGFSESAVGLPLAVAALAAVATSRCVVGWVGSVDDERTQAQVCAALSSLSASAACCDPVTARVHAKVAPARVMHAQFEELARCMSVTVEVDTEGSLLSVGQGSREASGAVQEIVQASG